MSKIRCVICGELIETDTEVSQETVDAGWVCETCSDELEEDDEEE
jgi:DNA-directed RNA polymerase subunit RPC12/RpoP